MINNRRFLNWWCVDVARNATQLALEIYARIPLLPGSLFLKKTDLGKAGYDGHKAEYRGKTVRLWHSTYGINVSIILVCLQTFGDIPVANVPSRICMGNSIAR